jgi:hypothetical protein
MNKYFIKIFLMFGFLYNVFGAIEDPVARHDLSECSTYLCPKYRVMAEDYMRSGCVGEFKDYALKGSFKEDITLNMISESYVNKEKSVSINSVLFLSTFSSLTSLYIGYKIGKKEKKDMEMLLMKEFD